MSVGLPANTVNTVGPLREFYLRADSNSPLEGPYTYYEAEGKGRVATRDAARTGIGNIRLELVTIVGAREGDPAITPNIRVVCVYLAGRKTTGGSLFTDSEPVAASAFTPIDDAKTFVWWDRETVATGLVSAWVDRKVGAVWLASGSARPTKSTTDLGGFPGVSGNGTTAIMECTNLGQKMSTLSEFTSIFCGINRSTTGVQIIWNHTINDATQAGAAGILVTSDLARINGDVRSVVSPASRGVRYAENTMQGTPVVVSIGHTFSRPDGISFIRVNGQSLPLTTVLSAATPTLFANAPMYLFARSGAVGPWDGTIGDFALREGILEDAGLDRIERFFGVRAGLTW